MREVIYTDGENKKYKVLLPDDAPPDEAEMGIRVGPPDLSDLGLPLAIEVRLNNALFDRGFFTKADLRRRQSELLGVWQAVLSMDIQRLQAVYEENG